MSSKLAPLTAAIVMCCQQPIMAVQLPDGRVAATILSFCKVLSLNYSGQLQKIRRNEFLAKHLLIVPIRTKGGVQEMDVLVAKALPRWLSTLQVSRLAPEKQQLAYALQQQAEDALEHHFSVEAAKEAPPSSNPSAEPPRTPRKMTHRAFERLHQAADTLHLAADDFDGIYMVSQEKIEAMGDHIVALEAEMAALKQGPASKVASNPRQPLPQDGPILTAEHRNQAYALARDERAGAASASIRCCGNWPSRLASRI